MTWIKQGKSLIYSIPRLCYLQISLFILAGDSMAMNTMSWFRRVLGISDPFPLVRLSNKPIFCVITLDQPPN